MECAPQPHGDENGDDGVDNDNGDDNGDDNGNENGDDICDLTSVCVFCWCPRCTHNCNSSLRRRSIREDAALQNAVG